MTVMTGISESGGDETEEYIINPPNEDEMEVEEVEEVKNIEKYCFICVGN